MPSLAQARSPPATHSASTPCSRNARAASEDHSPLSQMTTTEKLQQVQLLSDGQITDADAKAGVGGEYRVSKWAMDVPVNGTPPGLMTATMMREAIA